MSAARDGGVFVSYRREAGGDAAGRLADRLVDRLGTERVFMDVDAIEPGMDYVEAITRAVTACDVLVAVIGPGWLTAAGEHGRRLDDPSDWVRVEVGTALSRGVRVIPALVGGANMPTREDLPGELAGLARRNALRIRHESFRADAGHLVEVIERVLASSVPLAYSDETTESAVEVPDREIRPDTGAGQVDALQAIHLFVDAGRVADSITDKSAKASALSSIARAVAVTDPRRAARLFVDAERVADSVTSESAKGSALSNIAQALVATDPDGAERVANSITDESTKGWALSHIAQAVAGANPDRAERIANSIADESAKGWALGSFARVVAGVDPDRAERIADSIKDESARVSALSSIARARI
jgi:hypothetical protein